MKIAVITDMDLGGSGYKNLTVPILDGLSRNGHKIKVAGLSYKGEEHWWDFSIIPADNLNESIAIVKNLEHLWNFDVLIVLLDIFLQGDLLKVFQTRNFKYIGVLPIEAPPLCDDWAMILAQMDKTFIISEFGAKEAQRMGIIDAEHL